MTDVRTEHDVADAIEAEDIRPVSGEHGPDPEDLADQSMPDEMDAASPPRRRMSPFAIVILVAVVGLLGVLGLQLIAANRVQPQNGPAPDFTLDVFDDMHADAFMYGDSFALSDHLGKVVVINFWASWCGPCRSEAPALQEVWEAYKDRGDVVLLGVDYVDNTQDALGYIDEFGITYPNGPDLGTRISDAYHIQGVPETFVVGKDGNIFQFIYAGVTARDLASIIDAALSQDVGS
jgi:cytochrome c biogenesis protein CcmG/thiol:disulfide interchange protein DsbE